MFRNKNGVTLLVLVITIIVLVILSGVTLRSVVGEDSITEKTVDAKKEDVISREKQDIQLAYTKVLTKNAGADITINDLQKELDKIFGTNKTRVSSSSTAGGLDVLCLDSNNEYTVTDSGVKKK